MILSPTLYLELIQISLSSDHTLFALQNSHSRSHSEAELNLRLHGIGHQQPFICCRQSFCLSASRSYF